MDCQEIRGLVEYHSGIPNIAVKERNRQIIDTRIVYYELSRLFDENFTLAKTGAILGKDHATVIFHLRTFKRDYGKKGLDGRAILLTEKLFRTVKHEIKSIIYLGRSRAYKLDPKNHNSLLQANGERVAVFKRSALANRVCKILNSLKNK